MDDSTTNPALPECDPEWPARPVSALATHVSSVYHEHTRNELPVLMRRVTELGENSRQQLRALVAMLSELRDAAIEHDDMPADWRELAGRLLALRDHLLEELDLEDRCLLPRARLIADVERTAIR